MWTDKAGQDQMRMTLVTLAAISLAASTASAADTNRGACSRLSTLLEVADLAEGFEDIPAIALSGDDNACAIALQRLGQTRPVKHDTTGDNAPRICPRTDGD